MSSEKTEPFRSILPADRRPPPMSTSMSFALTSWESCTLPAGVVGVLGVLGVLEVLGVLGVLVVGEIGELISIWRPGSGVEGAYLSPFLPMEII